MTVTSKVQTHLDVREIDDSHWTLLSEFVYDSKIAGARIVVQAGFVTDFASVPRVPLAFWLVGDTAHMAAVVHDFLYQSGIFPRLIADKVLYEAMLVTNVVWWKARLIYLGVRVGGSVPWDKYRG